MRKYVAEGMGTFALVFVGTGAIVVNELTQGVVSHVGVALAFGLIVMSMVYAIGDVSGAHINPAVTVGFWIARRLRGNEVLPYIGSQLIGAAAASALVRGLFGAGSTLGSTAPANSVSQAFLLEIVLTLLLMFTILNVATGDKEKRVITGLAIGSVVGLAALFAGPISGASMNPARSLGPALLSGQLQHLWIYLVAPVLGAGLAVIACRCSRGSPCCS